MGLLHPSAVVSMRATMNRALPGSATIERAAVENVGGEEVRTWGELSTVACRLTFIGGGEGKEVGARIAEETTHLVTVPAGTDIEEADRVVIDSTTYEVTLVRKRGEWELSRRVEVKEMAE